MKRIKFALAACMAALAVTAHAAWPERPIRVVIPTPAGGSADVIGRTIGTELSARLGQAIVIDNKPGAAGNIGAALVAKAPADGYTLLLHAVSLTVNPWLYKDPGYDLDKSFAPVAMLGIAPNILFVAPSVQASNLAQLVALAKTEKLAFASSGNGTTTHLGAEMFFREAGLDVMHVPYAPGTGLMAVAGSQVPIGSAAIPPVVQLAKTGKVKAIAVTSAKRSGALPDVPTVAESGYPGFEATTWFALFAPVGTPEPILDRLNKEIEQALGTQGVKSVYEDIISVVEGAHEHLDLIMVPKVMCASDVRFVDTLLSQIERKLKSDKRIGLEVLIEEVEAMMNVEEIARSSSRLEALIYGVGDYSASQGIDLASIGGPTGYPGDMWHYGRHKITIAARANGLDAIDGPMGNFKDLAAYAEECRRARLCGMVGKWAIHPAQIEPALEAFSPTQAAVDSARAVTKAYREAEAQGLGAVNFNGEMIDAASVRILANVIDMADRIGM